MLKQGSLTAQDVGTAPVGGDVGTTSQLPPLNNLPQWSRINTLDKARYPKPFLKDRLQPLPNMGMEGMEDLSGESPQGSGPSPGGTVAPPGRSEGTQRIQHLEKSIQFLQVQHQEVLVNLHDEIEKLKRENKELQFKIIMVQKNSPPGTSMSRSASERRQSKAAEKADSAKGHAEHADKEQGTASASSVNTAKGDDVTTLDAQSAGTDSKLEELRVIFLEEEVRDLKRQLKEEKARNGYLGHLLQQAEKQKLQTQQENMLEDQQTREAQMAGGVAGPGGSMVASMGPGPDQLPFNASMVPLQVRLPHKNPRPPTLAECEVIIRHLQQLNDKQAHELNQLKTDLRDVLYSHKWTPDAYLLAKAYVAEDDAKESAELGARLPRIPLKQQARKLPDVAYIQRDTVTLPALKQTMGNKAIERRKRTQVLQRSRVGPEVLP